MKNDTRNSPKNYPNDEKRKDGADEKVRSRRKHIDEIEQAEADAELREFKKYGTRAIS